MPQKYIRHFLTNEVLAKLLLASPFFRRGTEGVVSFNCNKLIIKKLLNPLNPPLKKGEAKSSHFSNFASTSQDKSYFCIIELLH
jgi:hypothetical protein